MNTEITGITTLLQESRAGSDSAQNKLINLVYPNLHNIAMKCMAGERPDNTLQPTALIHEAYIRIFEGADVDWQDRVHFYAIAARSMKRVLKDHGREFRAQRRGGGLKVALGENMGGSTEAVDVTIINQMVERLNRRDPDAAKVVELKFYSGLTDPEVAKELKMSLSSVRRHWTFARAWLEKQLSPAN